jgi:DNA-binding response OmpR family regulator
VIWTGNALTKSKPPPRLSTNPVLKPLFALADSGKSIILDSSDDIPPASRAQFLNQLLTQDTSIRTKINPATLATENGRMRIESNAVVEETTMPPGQRVLVVDDDLELCQLISQYLERRGFSVEAVQSGGEGVERALSGQHAIVVLDVMLPGITGLEVLRRVRAQSRLPVLMLTAQGNEQDRILGLEMGADDYLPKPFNPRELSARIEAILRRSAPDLTEIRPGSTERVEVEDVELDKGARIARRAGQPIDLTTVEFDLLETMLRSAGRVLSREEMVRGVLSREFSPYDRSIDTHVSNLRKKLGPRPDGLERIKGVRGIGYLYVLPHRSSKGEE